MDGRRPVRKGPTRGCRSPAAAEDRRLAFDIAYTSVLKRAIRTLWIVLDEMDLMWIPVVNDWRLNERHYGALQGLNKAETAAKHGEEQVLIWRRSYDIPPPSAGHGMTRFPGRDLRYAALEPGELPLTECAEGHGGTVPPLLERHNRPPDIRAGKRVVVAAHGNSLRALVKIPRRHLGRRHRRAQHPHRHPVGL